MKCLSRNDIAAAMSGLDEVVATATFLVGAEVDEVLIASIAGEMSVVTHQGCDPTRPDAGSSGVLAVKDIDEARREFGTAVEENLDRGMPVTPAILLHAKDFTGRDRWLVPLDRHRVAWSRTPVGASICLDVASSIALMERSCSNACEGVEEIDPRSIRAALALLEVQDLSADSAWKLDNATILAFRDEERDRLLLDQRTGMFPRNNEHLASLAEDAMHARPVAIRTHLDPRGVEFGIETLRTVEQERQQPETHCRHP